MIIVKENLITSFEVYYLQSLWKSHQHDQEWRNTAVINLEKQLNNDEIVLACLKKIELGAQEAFHSKFVRDWSNLVYWPKDSYQDLHLDLASKKTVLSSITYLNTNFQGGETFFQTGETITPKVARTIYFEGQNIPHGVTKIIEGFRLTLPIWYKNSEE